VVFLTLWRTPASPAKHCTETRPDVRYRLGEWFESELPVECDKGGSKMPHNSRWKAFGGIPLARGMSLCLIGIFFVFSGEVRAQAQKIVWSDQEKPILEHMRTLRKLPEDQRARTTKQLALQIRQLLAALNKVRLANSLASLSTEGDLGQDTLQEVATTLAESLREQPVPAGKNGPAMPYVELAELARYEHVQVTLDDPQFAVAMSKLEANDVRYQQADFALEDLHGKKWALKDLRGKVVLVNFWATWCPPCRSEMPNLETLYKKFKNEGLVVLSISDEDASKVKPLIDEYRFSYPILLDPGRIVGKEYNIEGIPKSFVYDRDGKLVALAIDMRTKRQFLEMLAQAGLH
jgi:peroxiredoxin